MGVAEVLARSVEPLGPFWGKVLRDRVAEIRVRAVDQKPWDDILQDLEGRVSGEVFRCYFSPTRVVSRDNGLLRVGTPSLHAQEWLSNRLLIHVQRAVKATTDEELEIEFVVA